MPALNECGVTRAVADPGEDFVHLDMDLELELELELELAGEFGGRKRSNSMFADEVSRKLSQKIAAMSAPSRVSTNGSPAAPNVTPNVGLPSSASALSLTSSLLMSECGGPPSIISQPQESQPRPASPPQDHNSLCHLRAAELFPKKELEAEEPCLAVPFVPICGEAVQYLGRTQDGILALSNYRVYHRGAQGAATIIPLMLVESADIRDIFYLHIMCKDARSLRCTFANGERCAEWLRRIETAIQPPSQLEELFAFPYHAWAAEPGGAEVARRLFAQLNHDPQADFKREVSRLQFDLHGAWRVSSANSEFRLCPSYPPLLLVPACVSDDELETVAKFRSSRRIPAVVWRHRGNGAVIARCSQPEVGWLGWRSNEDEQLIASVWAACNFDRGPTASANTVTTSGPGSRAGPKVLIVDARSYTSAVTNRARGGGCECPQYYPCAEIQFMCLPNIHSVRKSFQALRALAAEPPDHANWHSVLERSLWLQAVGGLLRAACLVARAVHVAARPTLVHCSDGWDRTPQIVATAQLLLDPYYRTCEGFRVLVEREWLDFGHKFADRCGHTVGADNVNERCPVFLQWLDCVHQILVQYPCSFEFSQAYLIKLAQHAYSCLFGTFLCNTRRERTMQRVAERTFSVWQFLRGPAYLNHLYEANKEEVLYPAHSARALVVWAAVYLGAAPDTPAPLQPPAPSASTSNHTPTLHSQPSYGGMTKTRSYGDLLSHSEPDFTNYGRRSSDPSISVDPLKLNSLTVPGSNGQPANNNSSDHHQPLLDEYSDDSVDSDSILGQQQQQPVTNGKCATSNGQPNYIQMQNLLNTSDSLINTMIPKQVLNGYSPKANGNIVPIHNGSSIDTNSNNKNDEDYEADLINKLDSNGIYENGNTPMVNEDRLLLDSPDQIDGPNTEYAEQAIETIPDDSPSSPADYPEERPARIVSGGVAFKSGSVVLGLTPTEDTAVFLDGNFSESGDSVSVGRVRNESLTWRSISECSQQTDSSSGCVDLGAELNSSATDAGNSVRTTRRQRFDSVQNGGLNDTAAILLETEIGNLISEESAANRLEQQQQNMAEKRSGLPPAGSFVPVHRRQRSDGGGHFEHFPPLPACANVTDDLLTCSDMTLCPNSPLRAYYRTQSAGASNGMSRWHGRSAPASCSAPADGVPDKSLDRASLMGVAGQRSEVEDSWRGCACDLQHHHDRLGWPHHSHHCRRVSDCVHNRQCGNSSLAESSGGSLDPVDGLVCPQSPVQHRLHQIILDHKMREEKLMRDLHSARVELLQRACRTARLTPDHTDYYPPSESSSSVAGEGGGGGAWQDGITRNGVLWVPDHAVSRCTRCATHFWLGKRKHHCRSCGRIFCAECSENTTPLPNEQLYSPVRVCAECFASLAPPLTAEERMSRMEQSTSVKSQGGARSRHSSLPANSNNHANPSEVRHLSEYCKQVTGEQKLTNSSQVTAASN